MPGRMMPWTSKGASATRRARHSFRGATAWAWLLQPGSVGRQADSELAQEAALSRDEMPPCRGTCPRGPFLGGLCPLTPVSWGGGLLLLRICVGFGGVLSLCWWPARGAGGGDAALDAGLCERDPNGISRPGSAGSDWPRPPPPSARLPLPPLPRLSRRWRSRSPPPSPAAARARSASCRARHAPAARKARWGGGRRRLFCTRFSLPPFPPPRFLYISQPAAPECAPCRHLGPHQRRPSRHAQAPPPIFETIFFFKKHPALRGSLVTPPPFYFAKRGAGRPFANGVLVAPRTATFPSLAIGKETRQGGLQPALAMH